MSRDAQPESEQPKDDEIVAVYDADGRLTETAPRSLVRARNLRHACVAVLVRNGSDQVYLHRRTETKDVYPGHYDVVAGGVLQPGETPMNAALREVEEELGVTGVALVPLGEAEYEDDVARYHAFGYLADYDGPIRWQPEEVAWGAWVTLGELRAMIADPNRRFAPDTLALLEKWMAAVAASR